MKLELSEVKFASQWDAKEIGTLGASLEKGDKLRFAKFKDGKRVSVLITEKGEDAPNKQVACSAPLSEVIKKAAANGIKQSKLLKAVVGYNIVQNDKGTFITAPMGAMNEDFTFEQINKEEAVNYEELVGF